MITIAFATETGSAESLAEEAAEKLSGFGLVNRIVDLGDMDISQLEGTETLIAVVSTWGDGEPPGGVEGFFGDLQEARDLRLSLTSFAVLALGDSSYDLFCQFGKDLDSELAKRGARRILPRVDCDIDYEEPFEQWINNLVYALKSRREVAGV
ncbi:MAG: flavodoxin domain-containing protein [Verrucomicrobiales bacterium]|nr:flavodoxin domain-containing protein [Verrucomicrobiales bacterium]